MKKKTLSRSLSIIILLGITFIAGIAVVPVLFAASGSFESFRDNCVARIREKTGFDVSYKALSPSVLSGIRMSDIAVTDIKSGKSILCIRSVKLKWNFLKLITGKSAEAFGELLIAGVHVDYNDFTQYSIRTRLFSLTELFSADGQGIKDIDNEREQKKRGSFADVLFSLPVRIRIKNASFVYSDSRIANKLQIANLKINRPKNADSVQLQLTGKNSIKSVKKGFLGTFALGFSIQANVTPFVENSFAQLRLSSLRDSDYRVPVVSMYASYSSNIVQLSLMQNALPFILNLSADTLEQKVSLKFQAQDLNLFNLFRPKKNGSFINKIPYCFISGDYEAFLNWKTQELDYKADGGIKTEIPLKEKANVFFRFAGSEKNVDVDFLTVDSSVLSANYSGSIDIKNLRPQGTACIHSAVLPNGNAVSAELYMESFGNETLVFIPQLYFGENSLTALQLRLIGSGFSRDFTFEAFDYSKAASAGPGSLTVNGSFSFAEQKDMQIQLSTENLFLDSALSIAIWCLPEDKSAACSTLLPFLNPYIFSFDLFFSTDFKTFTYNSPYAVIANIKKDNELLLFSIDGTESVFQISRFDALSSGQSVQLQANADISSTNREVFFTASLFVNSLPYSFSGVFVPLQFLNITGDYNFNASVYADEKSSFSGSVSLFSLPVAVNNLLFSSSLSIQFVCRGTDDWNVQIEQIEIAEVSNNSRISAQISLAGSIDPGGLYLNETRYSDKLSSLDGNVNVLWSFSGGSFKSLSLNAFLADSFSPEMYSVVLQAHNPGQTASGVSDFLEHVYFSGEAEIHSLPSARFMPLQNENNTISGKLTALGTLTNPSLQLNIEGASFSAGESAVHIQGGASLEDKNLVFSECSVSYGNLSVGSLSGNFSLKDFAGQANGLIGGTISDQMYFDKKTFSSPFVFTLVPAKNNEALALKEKSFQAELLFSKLEGSFFKTRENYKIRLNRLPGRFDFTAGLHEEFSAVLFDGGEISLNAGQGFPVQFKASGILQNKKMFLAVENIAADAKTFSTLLDLPFFSLYSGRASGSGTITGTLNDPIINAEFRGIDMSIGLPDYVDEKLVCTDFRVKTVDNVFSAVDSRFIGEKSDAEVSLTADLVLKKLLIEYLSLKIKNLHNAGIAGKYTMPNGVFTGQGKVDISVQLDKEIVDIRGLIEVENIEAVIVLNAEAAAVDENQQIDTVLDLTIVADTKSRLFIPSKTNPFLRGLVTQTSPLHLQLDTRYRTSSFSGNFSMKGGEILYLNRTFYVREASAVLNESIDTFDPRLTARAEIRERDKNGDPVRIILSVTDQPLSRLNPVFSSIPIKSQQEIMTLLGQIFLADVTETNPLALIGGLADYGAQITVFRTVEDRLRDLFKFDIFSVRTMFLQNAFVSALKLDTGTKVSAGNFLDNTTVYIGKYFGDTLYADAMLHLAYNENLEKKDGSIGGLIFQPEIGLELPTPFAAIRWSIAPELNSDWKLLVPHTSISFSWKFNF